VVFPDTNTINKNSNMKHYIILAVVALSLMSCDEDEITYTSDVELQPYIEKFFTEAEEHGVTLEKNLVARLGYIQGVANYLSDGDK
jgi:ribosomal protein L17